MVVDESSPQYRCCCGACRAKIGAMIVAGFEGLLGLLLLIFGIIVSSDGKQENRAAARGAAGIFYFLATLSFFFVIILVIGVLMKKPWLLIIHMIKSGCFVGILALLVILGAMAFLTAGTGMIALGAVDQNSQQHQHEEAKRAFTNLTVVAGVSSLFLGVYTILQIWFIFVVLAAYRFVRDSAPGRGGVVLAPPPTQPMTTTSHPIPSQPHNYQVYQTTTYVPPTVTHVSTGPPAYSPFSAAYPSAPPAYSASEKY